MFISGSRTVLYRNAKIVKDFRSGAFSLHKIFYFELSRLSAVPITDFLPIKEMEIQLFLLHLRVRLKGLQYSVLVGDTFS